jgi:hypothetical protein
MQHTSQQALIQNIPMSPSNDALKGGADFVVLK